MRIRTYSDLRRLRAFEERYQYLRLNGEVASQTFGFDRYLNQAFYTSKQWRDVRNDVISRDEGRDLGVPGFEIYDKVIIHHMNPMTARDLQEGVEDVLDPEFLVTTCHRTHNAIHFGDEKLLREPLRERRPGDTRLW